jgi:hypothetical protein
MSQISSSGLVDKAKRAFRAMRKRDPSMPELVAATGEMKTGAGAAIYVILKTVDGDAVVKKFTPRTGWRQRTATPLEIKKLGLTGLDEKPTATLEDELRRATDVFVAAAAAVERRVYDTRDSVGGMGHTPHPAPLVPKSNGAGLSTYNSIAAE